MWRVNPICRLGRPNLQTGSQTPNLQTGTQSVDWVLDANNLQIESLLHGLNVASSLNLQNERPHLQIETLDEIQCGEQTQSADWYVSICRLSPLPQPKLQSKICHPICRLDLHNCLSQSADWAHMSKNIPATQLNLQIEPILHLHSICRLSVGPIAE